MSTPNDAQPAAFAVRPSTSLGATAADLAQEARQKRNESVDDYLPLFEGGDGGGAILTQPTTRSGGIDATGAGGDEFARPKMMVVDTGGSEGDNSDNCCAELCVGCAAKPDASFMDVLTALCCCVWLFRDAAGDCGLCCGECCSSCSDCCGGCS